jgi:hypothetical protein
MTTERIIDAAATMLETWADGIGLARLRGRMEAYDDVAAALQASADDVRLRVQPPEHPPLRVVPSTSKERDS